MRVRSSAGLGAAAILLSVAIGGGARARACGDCYMAADPLEGLAVAAVEGAPAEAARAIQDLRASGPAGLEILFARYGETLRRVRENPGAAVDPAFQRLRLAIEKVARQRDAHASRLYWHTDMEEARQAAKREGKPILSLRLLGNLDDEVSCANSRFFRTVLYANEEVSAALRERFVLHWKSVRPVPRITIDFGDGRRIERTITGNSVHWVLDAEGRPVDAIPGLYGPKAFLRALAEAEGAAIASASARDEAARAGALGAYHAGRVLAIQAAWEADLRKAGGVAPPARLVPAAGTGAPGGALPTAVDALPITASKSGIERRMTYAVVAAPMDARALETATADAVWTRIAALHVADARLDDGSRALMRAKLGRRAAPDAAEAGRVARSKMIVEDPLVRIARAFERSISEDTVRNEYLLRRRIHEWFAGGASGDVEVLNDRVYAELFLTPRSDPWLGLVPSDAYSALDGDGLAAVKQGTGDR